MMNILNGGSHADSNVDFQEFMVMPVGAETFSDALRWGTEVFHTLKGVLRKGDTAPRSATKGASLPSLKANVEAIELILEAISLAGYTPGEQIAIALDPAASEFFDKSTGKYIFRKSDRSEMSSEEMFGVLGVVDSPIPHRLARRWPRRGRLGGLAAPH